MKGANLSWFVTFAAQVGLAAALIFYGEHQDKELGRLLAASAFGQLATAGSSVGKKA